MSGTGVISGAGLGVSGGKQRGVQTITSKAVLIGHESVPALAVSQLSTHIGGTRAFKKSGEQQHGGARRFTREEQGSVYR